MKSPVFCARKIRAVVSRVVFLTCMAVVLLSTPTLCSAQDSQPTPAKSAKSSKKVKAAQPVKSTGSPNKTTNNQATAQPPSPTPYARKQQAEYGLGSRDEDSEQLNRAASEAYAARAYPAPYVPHQLTVNAQKGWAQFKAAAARTTDPLAAKQWNLVCSRKNSPTFLPSAVRRTSTLAELRPLRFPRSATRRTAGFGLLPRAVASGGRTMREPAT